MKGDIMRNRKALTERAEKFMEKFQNNLAYLRDENMNMA